MRLFFVPLLATCALACGNPAKREAASLVSAVDRFRRAGNPSKPQEARTIASVACADPEVCAAKEACLAASEPTAKALALKNEVEHGVSDLEQKKLSPDDPVARSLPEKLDQAQHLLEEGHGKMAACDEKVGRLRIKYGL